MTAIWSLLLGLAVVGRTPYALADVANYTVSITIACSLANLNGLYSINLEQISTLLHYS
jgi:hypothetical protein